MDQLSVQSDEYPSQLFNGTTVPCKVLRAEVSEAMKLAQTRCEVAQESYEDQIAKLRMQGVEEAKAIMAAKSHVSKTVVPKLSEIADKMADLALNRLNVDTSEMSEAEKKKHENLAARSVPKLVHAIEKVSQAMDAYSTHPALDVKATFVGKIDARTVRVGAAEGGARLKRAAGVVVEQPEGE